MERGWIKIYRKLADNDLWLSVPFTPGQAWIDLLITANYKASCIHRRGILVNIERGQVGHSEEALALRWKWSKGKVRRFLNALQKSGQIIKKTELKNIRITSRIQIINYDKYQSNDTENGTEDSTKDGTENGTGTRISKKEKKEDIPVNLPGHEKAQLQILKGIPGYPFNAKTDLTFLRGKAAQFPKVDIVSLLQNWGAYLLDAPLKPKSRPRAQLHTQFEKAMEWGKYQKADPSAPQKTFSEGFTPPPLWNGEDNWK